MTHLQDLIDKSVYIIREVNARFKNPAVLWSTGKDSTASLSLIREALYGEIPWPVIHLDTGFKFPEIYEFRKKITELWNLNLIVSKSDDVGKVSPRTHSHFECCTKLKTEAFKKVLQENNFDAIIVSIRRDEHGVRNKERFFSPRDQDFQWKFAKENKDQTGDSPITSLQDTELSGWNLFATDFGPDCDHVRIHPILEWTEEDIWHYIKVRGLPINPLYFSRNCTRYRSLGCMPCTSPISSRAKTIDEVVEELQITKEKERAGRTQDKENIMEKLRYLGYP